MCLVAPEDKSDSPITCASTTKVPDRDGVRFCRVCQAFKPVSIFPAGPRRFACRTHFWERQGKLRKLVLFTNPRKRAVICLWKRLYEDSRTIGVSIALTQVEVAEMLETLEENDHRWRFLERQGSFSKALRFQNCTSPLIFDCPFVSFYYVY